MSEESKKSVMYKKKYLETIAKLILNNKEFSDVTFVVNKKKYHASRILMSAASEVFASILKEHFNNTTDKEVLLQDIKHNDSFFNILQYIHGIEINLTTMSKVVFCEMLRLSERYKLAELHQDLKSYFSNVKRFKMNSLVAMLNTAKTYDLIQLYDKLKIYVYQHVEQVIKHKTFVNLQYDVLVDLLKSDWLYAKEIDILRAALNWHDENIMDVPKEKNETLVEDDGTQNEVCLDDEDIESEDEEAWSEIDMVDEFLSKYSDELFACETPEIKQTDVQVEPGTKMNAEKEDQEIILLSDTICENKNDDISKSNEKASKSPGNSTPEAKEISEKSESSAVEQFSENILKTLMKQIRFSQIPAFDLLNALDSELFIKYKENIINERDCTDHNGNPREIYSERFSQENFCTSVTRKMTFTLNNVQEDMLKLDKFYFCNEAYSFGKFHLTLFAQPVCLKDIKYLAMYLKGSADNIKNWKLGMSFQIILLSFDLSTKKTYQKTKCFFDENKDDWGWKQFIAFADLFDPKNKYLENNSMQFEVHFEVNETELPKSD